MLHRSGSQKEEALEDRMIQSVKHGGNQRHRGQLRMSSHAENQSRPKADENDSDVLDAVVSQEPFEIMLHQGVQDSQYGGDDSNDEHEQAGPGWDPTQRIQKNARHAVDSGLDHDAGKQS